MLRFRLSLLLAALALPISASDMNKQGLVTTGWRFCIATLWPNRRNLVVLVTSCTVLLSASYYSLTRFDTAAVVSRIPLYFLISLIFALSVHFIVWIFISYRASRKQKLTFSSYIMSEQFDELVASKVR